MQSAFYKEIYVFYKNLYVSEKKASTSKKVKEDLVTVFGSDITELLEKYKNYASIMEELLSIPRCFDMTIFSNDEETFHALADKLCSLFHTTSEKGMLNSISKTLEVMCSARYHGRLLPIFIMFIIRARYFVLT